jgi:hypothetical protein
MENAKFTKGKWTRYTASIPSIDDKVSHSVYVQTKRIALCYNLFENDQSKNVNKEEAPYNALLISNCPELLENAQMHIDALDLSNVEFYEKYGFNVSELIPRTRELIKQSTEL